LSAKRQRSAKRIFSKTRKRQQLETQIFRRKCDNPGCASVIEIDPQNPPIGILVQWIAVTFMRIVNGQPKPIMKHGCQTACAVAVLQLEDAKPAEQKPEDRPDLDKLRAAATPMQPHLVRPS
jgi:hypothetical protein